MTVANATYAELGFTSSGWILTSIEWMFRSTFVQYGRVNFLASRRVAGDGCMSYKASMVAFVEKELVLGVVTIPLGAAVVSPPSSVSPVGA